MNSARALHLLELIRKHLPLGKLKAEDPTVKEKEIENLFSELLKKYGYSPILDLNVKAEELFERAGRPSDNRIRSNLSLFLQFDGASKGNPGPAGAGIVISADDNTVIFEDSVYLGEMTNNAAEYSACILGLQKAAQFKPEYLTVRSDSELLVKQISGEYKVKNASLSVYFSKVKALLARFPNWNVIHVLRDKNSRADSLANKAVKDHNSKKKT